MEQEQRRLEHQKQTLAAERKLFEAKLAQKEMAAEALVSAQDKDLRKQFDVLTMELQHRETMIVQLQGKQQQLHDRLAVLQKQADLPVAASLARESELESEVRDLRNDLRSKEDMIQSMKRRQV